MSSPSETRPAAAPPTGARLEAPLLLGLGACLLLPSTGDVSKYLGSIGVVAYLVVASAALWIALRTLYPWFLSRLSERQAVALGLLTLLALTATFAVVFPYADAGHVGGGSDADEALNIAATELFHGRSPYVPKTYLGNPIGRLPGSVLFSAPFVLLGDSAYQNPFWMAVLFFAARSVFGGARPALAMLWLVCGLSPLVMQLLVTGNDRLANTIYVLLLTLLLVTEVPKREAPTWRKALAAVLLGVALVARANFVLLLPLVFSSLVQNAGWRPAIRYLALTGLVMGVTLLPFYLWDPSGFVETAAAQGNKLARFDPVLPAAGLLVSVAAALTAVALSFQRMDLRHAVLTRNCAIVQVIPVASSVLLSVLAGAPDTYYVIGYGMHFMLFGVWAAWQRVVEAEST